MTSATRLRLSKTGGEITGIRNEEAVALALENACLVAKTCEEFRGTDTVVLDVTHITPLFDYFVISTGRSRRQLHAMADHADDAMAAQNSNRRSTTGYETEWICKDYGDVVLHVFSQRAREQYDLESLWADAIRIDWQDANLLADSSDAELSTSDNV